MRTAVRTLVLFFIFITICIISNAQDLSLNGRSALELNLGLWGGEKTSNTVGVSGIQSEAGTDGFAGGLGYSYWLKEHLSLTLTVSLLSAKSNTTVSVTNVMQQASTVTPLLLGLRFYIPKPDSSDNIRPFLSAAVGSYFGSESANTQISQQVHTETAIGGRIGIGVDFFLGSHFKLGINAGYHLMADFKNAVGARKNYNGGELSLGAGYIF